MSGNIGENPSERTDSQRVVAWDGHMVLTALHRRQPHVTPRLTRNFIPERTKSLCQVIAGNVSRQPHRMIRIQAARISSRTKWSLTILGPLPSSKWQRTASRIRLLTSSIVSASVKIDSPRARAV